MSDYLKHYLKKEPKEKANGLSVNKQLFEENKKVIREFLEKKSDKKS